MYEHRTGEEKLSNALGSIRQGKGLGITEVPVIDLAFVGTGKVWHIKDGDKVLCGNSRGEISSPEKDIDAKVVIHKGRAVCFPCRSRLGSVPMPHLVSQPIHHLRGR